MNKILGRGSSLNVTECKNASFTCSGWGGAWLSKDLSCVVANYSFWELYENPDLQDSVCGVAETYYEKSTSVKVDFTFHQ